MKLVQKDLFWRQEPSKDMILVDQLEKQLADARTTAAALMEAVVAELTRQNEPSVK